jgi:hypothetical protein
MKCMYSRSASNSLRARSISDYLYQYYYFKVLVAIQQVIMVKVCYTPCPQCVTYTLVCFSVGTVYQIDAFGGQYVYIYNLL